MLALMATKNSDKIMASFYSLMPRKGTYAFGTSFLCAEKAGPDADSAAGIFPGLRKCFRICPGITKYKRQRRKIVGRFSFKENRQECEHPNQRLYRKGPDAPRIGWL